MDTRIESPAIPADFEGRQCATESCGEPAVASFEEQSFCMEHFAGSSIRALESRSERLRNQPFDAAATESFQKFLIGCASQANQLLSSEHSSHSPANTRLLEVLRLVEQLNQRLRRGPRTSASVPLWLRREDPGQTWEEETWTSSISWRGAGLTCRHRVEPGRTVLLCRRDRSGRVRARVVYSRFDSGGDRQIGVEILDRDDFWDASELARSPQAPTETSASERREEKPPPEALFADVQIEIAGQTVRYKQVPFQFAVQGNETRISGTIPTGLTDLNVDPASFFSDPRKNESPLRVEVTWRKEN